MFFEGCYLARACLGNMFTIGHVERNWDMTRGHVAATRPLYVLIVARAYISSYTPCLVHKLVSQC